MSPEMKLLLEILTAVGWFLCGLWIFLVGVKRNRYHFPRDINIIISAVLLFWLLLILPIAKLLEWFVLFVDDNDKS